jgi:hypothetical protein
MPQVGSTSAPPSMAQVVRTEEKGSDVNLATLLLWDAFNHEFELAVLITNDSDLLMPIELVRKVLKLQVGILNPGQRQVARSVMQPPFIDLFRNPRWPQVSFNVRSKMREVEQ